MTVNRHVARLHAPSDLHVRVAWPKYLTRCGKIVDEVDITYSDTKVTCKMCQKKEPT